MESPPFFSDVSLLGNEEFELIRISSNMFESHGSHIFILFWVGEKDSPHFED